MSIQSIINIAETLTINRRKVVGIQYSRNEIARTSELTTRNPWKFNLKISAVLPYDQPATRIILEELDKIDRKIPEVVNFSHIPWMFNYNGAMNTSERAAIRVVRLGGSGYAYNELVVDGLPTVGPRTLPEAVLFEKGDFVQVAGQPYPFTVTARVLRGSGSTVTLPLHRFSFLDPADCVDQALVIGNGVNFNVFCINMPTYTVIPGGRGGLIQFDDEFNLFEYTGSVV